MQGQSPVQTRLFSMQDTAYRAFQSKLIPTLSPARIIGVRMPQLRSFCKDFARSEAAADFLRTPAHFYLEENLLHALLLGGIEEEDRLFALLEAFLPQVDNWAVCDILRPKLFARRPPALAGRIEAWLDSAHPYTQRFAVEMLMCHYLGEGFDPSQPARVAALRGDDYYLNMMRAWYFATALAARYADIYPLLQEGRMDRWTHNKSIQKAVESRRISAAQKEALRALRRR